MRERIKSQIERFAPGFQRLILDRSELGPAEMEAYDASCVFGEIIGGVQDWRQLFTSPAARLSP